MLDSGKFLTDKEDAYFLSMLLREKNTKTLMLLLLRKYGMRSNELLALRPKDLNPEAKTMRVKGSKGSMPREMPLPDELFERLYTEARACLAPSDRIFPIAYHQLHYIWEHYRPAEKKLHSLRHTLAIEIYKKTKDIYLVRSILGHRSIANTMIYLSFANSQDEYRKVLVG
jgi:integrase